MPMPSPRAIANILDDPAEAQRRTTRGAAHVAARYDRELVFATLIKRLHVGPGRATVVERPAASSASPGNT